MALRDVTAEGVHRAIAEFDQLGREPFLERYGFDPARAYFLEHDGRRYDSKAIVGAAHRFSGSDLRPLAPSDFSGGERTVARLLTRLGFTVVGGEPETEHGTGRNPPWSDEELILALDLYLREGLLDDKDAQVIELSETLNRLPLHPTRPDRARFRNPNGVALKLANFAALDPGYAGKGMSRGAKGDAIVWDRFARDETALREAATRIREGLPWNTPAHQPHEGVPITPTSVGALHTERFTVEREASTQEAERREQQLVLDFQAHLAAQGRNLISHRYAVEGQTLQSDAFDETRGILYEAKGDLRRQSIRMAVGQLLDYARFHEQRPQIAVLLPRQPSPDILDYLRSAGVGCAYRNTGGGWTEV